MSDEIHWFDRLHGDVNLAQKSFEAGDVSRANYFLGCTVGVVRVLRDLLSVKKDEDVSTPSPANNEQ